MMADPRLRRKRDLEAKIAEDYELLKQLEDTLRYEDEPVRRGKLRRQIQELNTQVTASQTELESLVVQLRGTAIGLADEVRDYVTLTGWRLLDDLTITPGGEVEFVVERREGLLFQRVLVRCMADEADYPTLQRLRRAMSERGVPIGWLIAESRVDPVAQERVADDATLHILSLGEFFAELFPLDAYFAWLRGEYARQQIGDYYVNLACTKPTLAEEGREVGRARYDPIDEYIDRWLDDRGRNHISILGDFGMGKTWFCWHYAYRQMERYLSRPARERIPLLIPLRDYRKTIGIQQLFSDFFFRCHRIQLGSYSVFDTLNGRGKFLVLFDGFDEMAQRVDYQTVVENFWALAEIVVPGSKVILTCRTPYFRYSQEARRVLSGTVGQSKIDLSNRPRFEVLHLEEFNDDKIHEVFRRRLGDEQAEATWEHIQQIYDLPDLARRPVLLEMIIKTLPQLSSGEPVHIARLYKLYTDEWIDRSIEEQRTLITDPEKAHYFLQELAWEMYDKEKYSLHWSEFPKQVQRHFSLSAKSEIDRFAYDVRTNSFLVRNETGNYFFAHKSFMEYFIAHKMIRVLRERLSDPQGDWSNVYAVWGARPLTPEIHNFLREALTEKERLWTLLRGTAGKTEKQAGHTGSNVVALLRSAGASLRGVDLSGCILKGADLTDVDLTSTIFRGAVLRGARLQGAILKDVDCTDADLSEIDLFEGDYYDEEFMNWAYLPGPKPIFRTLPDE